MIDRVLLSPPPPPPPPPPPIQQPEPELIVQTPNPFVHSLPISKPTYSYTTPQPFPPRRRRTSVFTRPRFQSEPPTNPLYSRFQTDPTT